MSNKPPLVLWFRRDLRLADNPALSHALSVGAPILPIYIHSPEEEPLSQEGGASRWWLHHSLAALDASLLERGSRLFVFRGPALEVLRRVIAQTGAETVCWNRRYEPDLIKRDTSLKRDLSEAGIRVVSQPGNVLMEPWKIETGSGTPYRVFTPFWKALREKVGPGFLEPAPERIPLPGKLPEALLLENLRLLPTRGWDKAFYEIWQPGEESALKKAKAFLDYPVAAYSDLRDRPAHSGTSRLSAHLVFGEISPHRLLLLAGGPHAPSAEAWIRQLVWRDFAWHLLYHYPHTVSQPLKEEFGRFPIRGVEPGRIAWEKGKTGYPIVDAGMRELWTTGWMHNRVRMIVASFLIKDLFIPWQDGARWFRDTLVDADLANNTLGWQWVAGCGADAAPYFRIFNPVSQSEKFDPDGHYLRRWLPELSGLSGKLIHQPWLAGSLKPKGYPSPIVNHAEAREQALEAYQIMRQGAR